MRDLAQVFIRMRTCGWVGVGSSLFVVRPASRGLRIAPGWILKWVRGDRGLGLGVRAKKNSILLTWGVIEGIVWFESGKSF
jgi:hypothetical protein